MGEPTIHRWYRMEAAFPFILQNLHRYFLYLAFIPLFFLWVDAAIGLRDDEGHVRLGLGGLILFVNAALLTGYSLSCHSLRHLLGGKMDCFSCTARARARHAAWKGATWFNAKHMEWAWTSLISVTAADLYIRLLALGVIGDPAIRL